MLILLWKTCMCTFPVSHNHACCNLFSLLHKRKKRLVLIFNDILLSGVLQVHSLQMDWRAGLSGPHSWPVWLLWASSRAVSCWWGYLKQHGWTPVQVWFHVSTSICKHKNVILLTRDNITCFFFKEWALEMRLQAISIKPWRWDQTIQKPGRTSTA